MFLLQKICVLKNDTLFITKQFQFEIVNLFPLNSCKVMDNLGSLENVYLIFSQRNVSNTSSVSIVISVVYFKLANVSFFSQLL